MLILVYNNTNAANCTNRRIKMTLAQAMKLGQAAKAIGSAMEVSKGMFRMTSVAYNAKGKAAVTPQTPWMTAVQMAAVLHVEL